MAQTTVALNRIRRFATMVAGVCVSATAARAVAQSPLRAFEHQRHQRVSCSACHGTGSRHATYLVRTPRDCAACHHDPRREQACLTCHQRDSLPAVREVTTPMSLSDSSAVTRRTLSFRHAVHLAARPELACRECHRTDTTLAVNRECGSCHASHHTTKAVCAECHTQPAKGVHTVAAHRSCAGSGCHSEARAPPPTLSRNLCVVCHRAQVDHEPKGVCAECHLIPRGATAAPRPPPGRTDRSSEAP